MSFPELVNIVQPTQPAGQDPTSVDPYLQAVKLDEVPGSQ